MLPLNSVVVSTIYGIPSLVTVFALIVATHRNWWIYAEAFAFVVTECIETASKHRGTVDTEIFSTRKNACILNH